MHVLTLTQNDLVTKACENFAALKMLGEKVTLQDFRTSAMGLDIVHPGRATTQGEVWLVAEMMEIMTDALVKG